MSSSHRMPGEHVYDGMVMGEHFPAHVLDRVKTMEWRDSDVVITTYPKSGTTWMQEIVYLIMNEADTEKAQSASLNSRVPFLEIKRRGNPPTIDDVINRPSPRLMKSHLPPSFFESAINNKKTKFIIVMRNLKDVLVSYYHFYRMNAELGCFTGNWDEFFSIFDEDRLCGGSWFDFNLNWWKLGDNPNVLILKYEDLIEDLEKGVTQVSSFLEKDLCRGDIATITKATTFDAMKKNSATNAKLSVFNSKVSEFIRKGQVGDWINYFSQAQSDKVDSLYEQRLSNSGIAFKQ